MAVAEFELRRMAEEEMDLARRLSWKELVRVTPWSDTYIAVSSGGPEVGIERKYIWGDDSRTSIRVEVHARAMHEPFAAVMETATVTSKGFE